MTGTLLPALGPDRSPPGLAAPSAFDLVPAPGVQLHFAGEKFVPPEPEFLPWIETCDSKNLHSNEVPLSQRVNCVGVGLRSDPRAELDAIEAKRMDAMRDKAGSGI
ncbi:MAG TPA: hypothetical protein VIT90_17830 [Lysobacter sp.]